MDICASSQERVLTLCLRGELDHHGAKGLLRRVEQEIDTNLPLQLNLDMSGVTFMDSSGIAVVMRCRQRMQELGGSVRLSHVSDQPRKVFDASGITRLIVID